MRRPTPPISTAVLAGASVATRALGVAVLALGIVLLIAVVAPKSGAQASTPLPGTPVSGTPVSGTPVAARAIARGHVLTADDLAVDTTRAASRADSVAPGWIARRLIAAGEPLREPAVAPAPLITAGSTVQAIYRGGGLALSVRGTALGDAALGGRVLVRVDATRRVEGIASAAGVVDVRADR